MALEHNAGSVRQPEHPTLLIPGPVEFDDAVLNAMSHYRYDRAWYISHSSR